MRVEALVALYSCLLDRPTDLWRPLYCLDGLEQSLAQYRLGPLACLSARHNSMHWVLDCTHAAHMEAAKKLVALSQESKDAANMWNIRLNGRQHVVHCDMLCAASHTWQPQAILCWLYIGCMLDVDLGVDGGGGTGLFTDCVDAGQLSEIVLCVAVKVQFLL
jgi:hypothetical protein